MPHYLTKIKFKFQRRLLPIFKRNLFYPSHALSTPCRNSDFLPFDTLVEHRKKQARKTIMVEVPALHNIISANQFLHSVCSNFGKIENMFEYQPPTSNNKMVLIEFEEEASLEQVLERVQADADKTGMAIQFPFLNLKKNSKILTAASTSSSPNIESSTDDPPHLSEPELLLLLNHNCKNMSQQIQTFYDQQKMTEVGWRIRFMTCRKIEWMLPKVFSQSILPFGSSVNSFGNFDCDLDMMLLIKDEQQQQQQFPRMGIMLLEEGEEDGLFPLQVMSDHSTDGRTYVQRNLALIADLMKHMVPGFTQVYKILQANVPIIRCYEAFTGLECDLTINNRSGYDMSELLYFYGCSDARVRPLVFSIRLWAKQRGVTHKMKPGRFVSNFSITLLVLFYLMNTKPGVILPLKDLFHLSGSSSSPPDNRLSFLKSLKKLPPSENTESLEELLEGFFEFYAKFNFNKLSISLISGAARENSVQTPLYIQNPIETDLNVSRNVNYEEVETFRQHCLNACYFFHHLNTARNTDPQTNPNWGLSALVGWQQRDSAATKVVKSSRVGIDWQDIFESNSEVEKNNRKSSPSSLQRSPAATLNKNILSYKSTHQPNREPPSNNTNNNQLNKRKKAKRKIQTPPPLKFW